MHELRQKFGASVSDEDLLLRVYAGADAVNAFGTDGAPKPRLDGKQSLLQLIEQLSKKSDCHRVYIRKSGFSLIGVEPSVQWRIGDTNFLCAAGVLFTALVSLGAQERVDEADEALQDEESDGEDLASEDERERLAALVQLRDEIGSEWHHGVTLIPDSEFEDYAQETAYDVGFVARDSAIEPYVDWSRWAAQKRQVNAAKSWIKVEVSDVSLMLYPGEGSLAVATFDQDYASSNLSNRMKKRQYWIREDGRWRILYEGAA